MTGGRWRASITSYGAIVPFSKDLDNDLDNDSPRLDWHIAADDRWHSPERETSVRQRRIDGTAVVETRVRVPGGDAVQRVYSVADHGGLTVIEVQNESPLPIAIAFTNGNLLSQRPPAAPIEGISLPPGSVAFPVGHHSTLTVAIPHTGDRRAAGLPAGLPTSAAVARGWLNTVERAGRLLCPDAELNERVVATRCELALCGPPFPDDDAVGFTLVVDQLVRMGESAEPFVPQLAHALELAAKAAMKPRANSTDADWVLAAALNAADRVLAAAGDDRARRDLDVLGQRLQPVDQLPQGEPADPVRALAWIEQRLVLPRKGRAQLLGEGLPASWFGNNFEVFDAPTDATGVVSFAVRWHGERPAVLWEQSPGADGPVMLTSPVLAPQWQSAEVSGEALWPAWLSGSSDDNYDS